MTQTNTNTSTGDGNTNRNQTTAKGGRGRGGTGGKGRGGRGGDRGSNTTARYSFEGKMKDGPISKLTITEAGQRATQFKKIMDALPVFCADKGYRFIDEIIRTNKELVEAAFMPTYPDPTRWSTTYHVQVATVNPSGTPDSKGILPVIMELQQKSHVSDPNLQKQLLSEYDQKSKLKLQEWAKLGSDKKSLITIIYGQCDDATRTEIALGASYEQDRKDGNLINFLERLQTVCYGSDDGGLSFKPYKIVVAVKSLNNFSNAKPNDPHGFKEELKIKYDAVLAVVDKFPNGTGAMMELLDAETPAKTWSDYCAMPVADQLSWEEKGDASTKAMLLLLNSKNDNAKKDLRLSYSQGNKKAYPKSAEAMARYLSTQYTTKTSNNQRDKKGDKNSKKGDDSKSEDKDSTNTGTAGAHMGDATTPPDSTAPSDGSSVGAHIGDAPENADSLFRRPQTVDKLLAAHPIDDAIWDHTNPSDVSIDTLNSAEDMAGIHITEGTTYTFHTSDSYGLTDTTLNVSHEDNPSWYDGSTFFDSLDECIALPNNGDNNDVNDDSKNESNKSDFRIGERQS